MVNMGDYFATDKEGGLLGLMNKRKRQMEAQEGEGTWKGNDLPLPEYR